jgi:ABC-type uncharacterized transport system fused permease/ATPase subunit
VCVCVCVCVSIFKMVLQLLLKVNVVFNVTKKQGICSKDLCYKLFKLFTYEFVNIWFTDGSYYRVNAKTYYSMLLLRKLLCKLISVRSH